MSSKSRRGRIAMALAGSFAVYLLPLLGPHAIWVLGESLWHEVRRFGADREPLWVAADLGLAVAFQAAAFILFHSLSRRRAWVSVVAALAAVVPATMALNWAYSIVIPTQFLIEADTMVERGDWEVACRVPDSWLLAVRAGVDLPFERAGVAWLGTADGNETLMMRMPGCGTEPLKLPPMPVGSSVLWLTPTGGALFRIYEPATGRQELWYRPSAGAASVLVEQMAALQNWPAVLSDDGRMIAWIEAVRGAGDTLSSSLRVGPLPNGPIGTVALDRGLGTQLQVISYDAAAREVVVSRYPNQIFGLRLDGNVIWGPLNPPGLQNAAENFRRLPGGGWLTWDGYRENGRYLVAWSRDGTNVRVHEVPKGRSITAVATNPSGTLIGVSVGRNLSIGDVRDAVYVLRTDTGEEIYRRYLPAYTRSQLAFLGDELIALTWFDGARGEVRVLRVSPQ